MVGDFNRCVSIVSSFRAILIVAGTRTPFLSARPIQIEFTNLMAYFRVGTCCDDCDSFDFRNDPGQKSEQLLAFLSSLFVT